MGHLCGAWTTGLASSGRVMWYVPGNHPIPSKWSRYSLMRSSLELSVFSISRSSCILWQLVVGVFCCVVPICWRSTVQLSSVQFGVCGRQEVWVLLVQVCQQHTIMCGGIWWSLNLLVSSQCGCWRSQTARLENRYKQWGEWWMDWVWQSIHLCWISLGTAFWRCTGAWHCHQHQCQPCTLPLRGGISLCQLVSQCVWMLLFQSLSCQQWWSSHLVIRVYKKPHLLLLHWGSMWSQPLLHSGP